MKRTWILVANRSEAKFFESHGMTPNPAIVEERFHPEGRMKASEVKSDRPGSVFERMGPGRSAMGHCQSVPEHEAEVFAKEIAERLDRARQEGEFDELVIFADPSFLGTLNKTLSAPTQKLVIRAVDRNLPDMTTHKLRPHLEAVLGAAH